MAEDLDKLLVELKRKKTRYEFYLRGINKRIEEVEELKKKGSKKK